MKWLFKDSFEKEIKSHKKELKRIEAIKRKDVKFLTAVDDSDQMSFLREIADWGQDEASVKYGYLRMNDLLSKMTDIQPGEEHKFWIARGQMAEIHQFLILSVYSREDYDSVRIQLHKASSNKKESKEEGPLVEQYN